MSCHNAVPIWTTTRKDPVKPPCDSLISCVRFRLFPPCEPAKLALPTGPARILLYSTSFAIRPCSPSSTRSRCSASKPCRSKSRSMSRPAALPKTVLVGLPEAAVKESTHRVERALVNCGFIRPHDRVVINLAPAELPKQAGSFDLPIALGMLAGSGQLASELFEQYAVVGELALEGTTRPVKGALSMAMAAAKQRGLRGIVVPDRKRRRSGRRRRDRSHPRRQPGAGRRLLRRHARDRADAVAARRAVSRSSANTTTTSPTSAARKWPSGRSSSPPPATTTF